MIRIAIIRSTVALSLVLAVSACGDGNGASDREAPSAGGSVSTPPVSAKDFGSATFTASDIVDNAWFPLEPGTRWTWEGHAYDDDELIDRKVVITVTDLTKVVDGVRARVVWDLDFNDGTMEESEIALFAQDDAGNVWQVGEYPEEYDDGRIVKTPAWIAGVEGAKAGLAMQADPRVGTPSYAEGWGPQVGWNDRAEIVRTGERVCVPVDCYDDVVVIKEYAVTEPGAFQLKYYADGVGTIQVGWGGPKEEEQEELVLKGLTHLDPEALAQVRKKVLAQDARGYRNARDVYGSTSPAEASQV
jgi:hypothetical protein